MLAWATLGEKNPFHSEAKRLIVAAGCHRLATGVGARFLESAALRKTWLGKDVDFQGSGWLAFRVAVRGARPSDDADRENFEGFEVLAKSWA